MLGESSTDESLLDKATQVLFREGDASAWNGRGLRNVARNFSVIEVLETTVSRSKAARNDFMSTDMMKS